MVSLKPEPELVPEAKFFYRLDPQPEPHKKFTGSVTLVVHKIQRSQRRIALQLWICQEDAALCTSNSGSATLLISVKGSTALISYISGFE
jgi:hypothetical protein